jgi:ATP-dependent phosphofructokinase / diphosphate-dependent phosphofructokinase
MQSTNQDGIPGGQTIGRRIGRRIGIVTAGGDCPGMNAAIRAVAKAAIVEHGYEVIGIEDGYEGLVQNRCRRLEYSDVSGIIDSGGTILGTSNSADPYAYASREGNAVVRSDQSRTALKTVADLDLECLVVIGGDGSFTVAERLYRDGVPVVGVPKTIDNDVVGTDSTIGFDTGVAVATDAIDRVHTSAESHHRVMVIEVMGRNAGWLGLYAGIAGGGDIILVPEMPYALDAIADRVKRRSSLGKRFTIVVVSEGARAIGGQRVISRIVEGSPEPVRLGGIGFALADQVENATGVETRALVLGHLVRGGPPTAADRVLATGLGTRAIDLVSSKEYGLMVGFKDGQPVKMPLNAVANRQKTVPPDHPLIKAARMVGTTFADRA